MTWANKDEEMNIDANECEGDDELAERVSMEVEGETVFRTLLVEEMPGVCRK